MKKKKKKADVFCTSRGSDPRSNLLWPLRESCGRFRSGDTVEQSDKEEGETERERELDGREGTRGREMRDEGEKERTRGWENDAKRAASERTEAL